MLPLPSENVRRIEKILDKHLSPDEVRKAHDLFKDRSRGIRWGRVVELLIDELVEDAYMLLHEIPLRKRADIYKPDQTGDFQEVVALPKPKDKHAEHLAVLQMAFKLLNVLRTVIRQRIQDIPIVTEDEIALFQDALGEASVIDDPEADPMAIDALADWERKAVEAEDTGTLIERPPLLPAVLPLSTPPPLPNLARIGAGGEDLPWLGGGTKSTFRASGISRKSLHGGGVSRSPKQDPRSLVEASLTREEPETSVEEDCAAGNHRRLVVLRKLNGEGVTTTRECKDCGKVLEAFDEDYQENPAICPHSKAHWSPNRRGEVAVCTRCGITVNEHKYDWNGAGLEEPGDQPSDDEVIELCTES
jgi:hypothetical protein